MYLNKVQLIGNLTRDPELKSLPSGTQVCSFSLATNETYMKEGKKTEKVEFHNIVVFGKTAENVARYMSKGSQIYVEGKLQTRSWDGSDGKKQYRTEINALTVQFGNKPKGTASASTGSPQNTSTPGSSEEAIDFPSEDINPEDIPF